ncbi:MAG: hypothetical protein PXY39_08345, partial [archaeon]|nr:hypothetical protein [archaeon]
MLEKESRKIALADSIIDCIQSALDSKYGQNVSQVIFHNYETKFGLSKREIITHAKQFEETLEDIFGSSTVSLIMKRTICKELSNKFQIQIYQESVPSAIRQIVDNAD